MRRIISALLLIIFISGCGSGLKQRWGDFNAYYNTFYNAQNSYKNGIRSVESQAYVINAERPIRIHRTPVRAGQSDFEKAIEKSADVLRDHSNSKWVDDALLLIGKSYFYQSQFFSAEQKFNEVLAATANQSSRQEAVLWKGLIYLETNRISEGLNYVDGVIDSDEYEWDEQTLAELQLVLAQLYIENDEFDAAAAALSSGLPDIRDELLRSRGHFLYGQILQRQQDYQNALNAYRSVSRKYPEYQLLYLAQVKQNEILREMGRHDEAIRNLNSMTRDDKNFDQVGDLNYEIGRTLQYKGEVDEAFLLLNEVLYSSIRPPARETISKSHFAIAELYRFDFQNYRLAAAHYDSASRGSTDLERLPEYFNAAEMAKSFGDFTRLNAQVNEMDSLLWLASLPEDEFEQVIEDIRIERQAEYERQQRQEQLRGTTLVNVNPGQNNQQNSREYGFLNHLNPEMVRQASESFAALWDERPLVDNWRRLQAVRSSGGRSSGFASDTSEDSTSITASNSLSSDHLNIDLSVIPFDSTAKLSMQDRLAAVSYEMGNVFYLNLDLPDSALVYYDRAIYEFEDASIRPQAIYTKADIYLSKQDTSSAQKYINLMIDEYPNNRITERLLVRLGRVSESDIYISEDEIISSAFESLKKEILGISPDEKLFKLVEFQYLHPETPFDASIFMMKSMAYAQLAMQEIEFEERLANYNSEVDKWNDKLTKFETIKDSVRIELQADSLDQGIRDSLTVIMDSVLTAPNLDVFFPYIGANWDSTRYFLNRIITDHSGSSVADQAKILYTEIDLPESLRILPTDTIQVELGDSLSSDSTSIEDSLEIMDPPPFEQDESELTPDSTKVLLPDSTRAKPVPDTTRVPVPDSTRVQQ
ncbi:MAG TPA: hypothetical protein DCE78_06290, partial [Bacteroidetes bacterium]|nr:hypothetical protein [Bacteroidota bacterium]